MSTRKAAPWAILAALYVGAVAGLWLLDRREKGRVRREKGAGRLPARRSPPTATPMNPALMATAVALWAFATVVVWVAFTALSRLLTPPAARGYLTPPPPFSQALRWNLNWCLFWAGLALLGWAVERPLVRLSRRFDDPAVSRALALSEAGDPGGAVRELQGAIDADGPSVARWSALADALAAQGRWAEALKAALDVEDRRPFDHDNRRRAALALCKLGFPEVALSLFRSGPGAGRRIAETCSYCEALTDLGLFDRAWDRLRRAEVMYGRGAYPRGEAPGLRERIDACRARLAAHFADEKPDALDEL